MRTWIGAVLLAYPLAVAAEVVTPKESVSSHVVIRNQPGTDSAEIGELHPGDRLKYLDSVPYWHKIRITSGAVGYVSKRYTKVVAETVPPFADSSFTVHFLDVGTGDAAIIDMGDREIIIDGGNYVNDLSDYIAETNIIDGDVELVIVTHGDQDHWRGLQRALGFDGVLDNPLRLKEYWDPGYNRDCNAAEAGGRVNYLAFVEQVAAVLPPSRFKRPLEAFHAPLDISQSLQPFSLPSLPGVTFTVLHSQQSPAPHSECSYMINNASIVLMIEIDGVKLLFTGDANGKERSVNDASLPPRYVEAAILTAAETIGTDVLNADILKVPHHGSETSNTLAFITAVDPAFAIISASTTHHLPKPTVVERYEDVQRVIMSTDLNHARMMDHILCGKRQGALDCQYKSVLEP